MVQERGSVTAVSETEPKSTRAREWMGVIVVRALACLRVGQFILWGWPLFVEGIHNHPSELPIGFVVLAAWTSILFFLAARAKVMKAPLLLADVAGAVTIAIVVSRAYPLGDAASTHNGVIAPICGTAVTVAVYARRPVAILGVGLVITGWLVGTWPDIASPSEPVVYSNAAVIAVFALVTRLNAGFLFEAARRTDAETDRVLAAQQREAAALARDQERQRQYAHLHDTVLHTLENIARGVWDVRGSEARQNCERDSEYLRGLITGGIDNVPTDLGTALAAMARDRTTLGSLRINQQFDALPQQIPQKIADAIVGVIREALNNVAKYAQVDEAWLTGYGNDHGGVTVKVVDRGVGFDPGAPHTGRGLDWSMRHRMIDAGGTLIIDSAPTEGTSVEVSWNP